MVEHFVGDVLRCAVSGVLWLNLPLRSRERDEFLHALRRHRQMYGDHGTEAAIATGTKSFSMSNGNGIQPGIDRYLVGRSDGVTVGRGFRREVGTDVAGMARLSITTGWPRTRPASAHHARMSLPPPAGTAR